MIPTLFATAYPAMSQQNCDTPLGRIARREVDKAIERYKSEACAGLKWGGMGIDKTKKFELIEFRLCESGFLVNASLKVRLQCASGGVIPASIEDVLTATAKADLNACHVDADIEGGRNIVKAGLALSGARDKLRVDSQKQIVPYCR
jgi:hypothetical protein